jgi:2'-5' RNA ligase superfamily
MAHVDRSPVIRASIWIPPSGAALDRIQHVIHLAHRRCGGPSVRPHVTLLSGIERTQASADVLLKHLAARLKPFTISLGRIEWRADYFRCFYATAALNENLDAAKRAAHEVFEMNPPTPFEPHLSLLYGNIDEDLKKDLAAELGGSVDVSFEAAALQLVNASQGVPVSSWKPLNECEIA